MPKALVVEVETAGSSSRADDTRATATPAPGPQHAAGRGGPQTARAVFDKYDTNRDGVLDQDEVAAMIDSIGYEVDASYVGGVMEIFGMSRYDSRVCNRDCLVKRLGCNIR
eukprot:COSAG05_NODE_10321_length_571_cov_1.828390_1_plen_111_part_00